LRNPRGIYAGQARRGAVHRSYGRYSDRERMTNQPD
jgi:hypothetical protein